MVAELTRYERRVLTEFYGDLLFFDCAYPGTLYDVVKYQAYSMLNHPKRVICRFAFHNLDAACNFHRLIESTELWTITHLPGSVEDAQLKLTATYPAHSDRLLRVLCENAPSGYRTAPRYLPYLEGILGGYTCLSPLRS